MENKLCNKSKKFFSKESQTEYRNYPKCGEIFISVDNELVLNCSFCHIKIKVLDIFWSHLFEKHCLAINKIKSDIELKDEFSTNSNNFLDLYNTYPNTQKDYDLNDISDIEEKYSFLSENSINFAPKQFQPSEDSQLPSELVSGSIQNENCDDEKSTEDNSLNKIKDNNNDRKHEEQNIPKGYWQCDICQVILKKGQERKVHEKTHKGVKRLICETCGKSYTSRNRLLDHIRTHTGEKPFKCRFCPKTFFSHSSMKSHDKTHIGFKPFKCDYCEHHFKTKLNKQIHEKKHHDKNVSEEKSEENSNVICKLCNKSFKCSEYLVLHLKRHEDKLNKSSPKPFECSFCPSTFISNVNKNAHERLYHKGEYNYKCDFCGKGFLKLNKKRQHEEMHTRVENPYKCDLCECEYARPEGLKKHKVAKHSKESPYKCKLCNAGFESSLLFKDHCRQHNVEEKIHGCNLCEARFDTQIRLDRHTAKMHNQTQIQKLEDKDESSKSNDVKVVL